MSHHQTYIFDHSIHCLNITQRMYLSFYRIHSLTHTPHLIRKTNLVFDSISAVYCLASPLPGIWYIARCSYTDAEDFQVYNLFKSSEVIAQYISYLQSGEIPCVYCEIGFSVCVSFVSSAERFWSSETWSIIFAEMLCQRPHTFIANQIPADYVQFIQW